MMPSSTQDISNENIQSEIHKTFAVFKRKSYITIADYLCPFPIEKLIVLEYRSDKQPGNAFIKALIFMDLKGIKKQTELEDYLRHNKDERTKLGFRSTPKQRMISHFIHNVLDDEQKNIIKCIVNQIRVYSEKFSFLSDIQQTPIVIPRKKIKIKKQDYLTKGNIAVIIRPYLKEIRQNITFDFNDNAEYENIDLFHMLFYMNDTTNCAENASEIFRQPIINELKKAGVSKPERKTGYPSADTILKYIKRFGSGDEIYEMFIAYYEKIWKRARKANILNRRSQCDVAIDTTNIYFYGSRNAKMVVGCDPKNGTAKCYRFATITILMKGKRFTLLAIPVGHFNNQPTVILKKLLDYAMERVTIGKVLVDRWFCYPEPVQLLRDLGLKYVTRCKERSKGLKNLLEVVSTPTVLTNYQLFKNSDMRFTIIIVDEERKDPITDKITIIKAVYTTNIAFNEKEADFAERMIIIYKKRWGIETSYRVQKHAFLPKTCSKNYNIRLFYFLFAIMYYNLWALAEALRLSQYRGQKIKGDKPITAKYFGAMMLRYIFDPGGKKYI